jgi:tousled-like kinase
MTIVFAHRSLLPVARGSSPPGVVLYQMLYGRKPFGHGLTADALLSSGTMQEATRKLEFPNTKAGQPLTPTQEFIQACLQYDAKRRPHILTIFNEKYFSVPMNK